MTFLNLFCHAIRQQLRTGRRAGLLSMTAAILLNSGCSMDLQVIRVADRVTPPARMPLAKPDFETSSDFSGAISSVRREAGRSPLDLSRELHWTKAATSAGGRSIDTVVIGDGDYRTLVLGSVGGDDEKAIAIVEKLADHLYQQRLILDGFETTIVRTLNPDGRAAHSFFNKAGVYINHDFPVALMPELRVSAKPTRSGTQPETTFLLSILRQRDAPRRVVHIRSVDNAVGIVGAGSHESELADDLAEWLNYERMTFPDNAAEGTLERMISSAPQFEMVTIAIPRDASVDDTWARCQDVLLSLLVPDELISGSKNHRRLPGPVATSEDAEQNRFRRHLLRAPNPAGNAVPRDSERDRMFDED